MNLIEVSNTSSKFKFWFLKSYYFDGRGKSVRPRLTAAMAEAVNNEFGLTATRQLFQRQQQVRVLTLISFSI
jgi:hypothetical protein